MTKIQSVLVVVLFSVAACMSSVTCTSFHDYYNHKYNLNLGHSNGWKLRTTSTSEEKVAAVSSSAKGLMHFRGGAILDTGAAAVTASSTGTDKHVEKWSLSKTLVKNVAGLWGVLQVVSILGNAIRRLIPIALQPFKAKDMGMGHWIMYVGWCMIMVYHEGYKAFQQKFSPLVVNRAFGLSKNPSILNIVLAGPYSMGLFGANKKRMIVSWCITLGVFSLVKVVKILPYPYRSIIDSGVVAGLSYGTMSMLILTVRSLLGMTVGDGDQALPDNAQ